MKRLKMLITVFVIGLLLSGCVKYTANMDIKSDKSMDFSIIYAIDKTVFGEENALKEEDFAEVKKAGFTISKYSEGNMEGFSMVKKINNIDDVSTEKDVIYDLSGLMKEGNSDYIFKVVKSASKNTYYATFNFDSNESNLNTNELNSDVVGSEENTDETFTGELENDGYPDEAVETTGEDVTSNLDLSSLMSNLDLSFNVTLPNPAVSSNATKRDNDEKNLTWTLTTGEKQNIEFVFELDNPNNNNLYYYIGAGAAFVIIVILIIVLSKKKKGNKEEPINNETVNQGIPTPVNPTPVVGNPEMINPTPVNPTPVVGYQEIPNPTPIPPVVNNNINTNNLENPVNNNENKDA